MATNGHERRLSEVPKETREKVDETITRRATPSAVSAYTSPLMQAAGETVAAVRGVAPTHPDILEAKRLARFDSVRAYRRTVDQLIRWSLKGKMSPRAAYELAQVVKIATEMLMSEHVLHAGGRTDQAPPHIDGPDGGAAHLIPSEAPRPEPEVTVSRRTGVDPSGAPIDETQVVIKGQDTNLALAQGNLIGPALAEFLRARIAERGAQPIAEALGMEVTDLQTLLNG